VPLVCVRGPERSGKGRSDIDVDLSVSIADDSVEFFKTTVGSASTTCVASASSGLLEQALKKAPAVMKTMITYTHLSILILLKIRAGDC
jgi:hypothetical protein